MGFFILKLLACFIIGVIFSYSGDSYEFYNIIKQSCQMEIFYNGKIIVCSQEDELFVQTIDDICCILKNAKQMPALGVSLDGLTREELKDGLWIQFDFEKEMIYSDMAFDSLLIKLEKDCYGLNVIRKYQGLYDGRCFYFDLDVNLNNLFEKFSQL
jgi:hypothetical protein